MLFFPYLAPALLPLWSPDQGKDTGGEGGGTGSPSESFRVPVFAGSHTEAFTREEILNIGVSPPETTVWS